MPKFKNSILVCGHHILIYIDGIEQPLITTVPGLLRAVYSFPLHTHVFVMPNDQESFVQYLAAQRVCDMLRDQPHKLNVDWAGR